MEMKTITKHRSNLAAEIARMGLPPLRTDDGSVELSIQEYSAKTRWVTPNYPADRIPRVGDDIKFEDRDVPRTFMVMEVKHLLVPRATETIRVALLIVERIKLLDSTWDQSQ